MVEKYNADLSHLTSDEVEVFYQRYLNEKTSDLVKSYNLKPSLANSIVNLLPLDLCSAACAICGEAALLSKKRSKTESSSRRPAMRVAQCSGCGHKQYLSDDLIIIHAPVENCNCEHCKEEKASRKQQKIDAAEEKRKETSKKIINAHTIDRRYIPFSESDESYNLAPTAMLMAMMFGRWNNIHDRRKDDDFIAPYKDGELALYPEQDNSSSHPLIQCIQSKLVFFDFERCKINDFVIEDNGSVSSHSRQLHFQTNFTDAQGDNLSIPETYEWLSRKFTDGYWYKNWDEQLLDVWLDLGVAECIEYAKSKAEEYSFGFSSEVKVSEIIRDLLHRHSVSECFYFISTSYWNAAAFYQSNKATNRKHAENTVPGKIISLANSGKAKQWDRPPTLPRSAFSLMLFDVMLNSKNDAGFHLCPSKDYQDLLNNTRVQWPEVEAYPVLIDITGKEGLYDFLGFISENGFEESTDSTEKQLVHLSVIAQMLGLNKAAELLNEKLLSEADLEYREGI